MSIIGWTRAVCRLWWQDAATSPGGDCEAFIPRCLCVIKAAIKPGAGGRSRVRELEQHVPLARVVCAREVHWPLCIPETNGFQTPKHCLPSSLLSPSDVWREIMSSQESKEILGSTGSVTAAAEPKKEMND